MYSEASSNFLSDVVKGLGGTGQKMLPCQYLYDDLGSALFEAITYLPEYGLTRADERLLARHAERLSFYYPEPPLVVELGSGTGRKTRYILQAWPSYRDKDGTGRLSLQYSPIDISPTALALCQKELGAFADIRPIHGNYLDGIRTASRSRILGQPMLLLFLGSTIGNFDRQSGQQFLRELRALLQIGDGLLIGADLIKPIDQMLLAYADPTGVTAAFNLNLLGRINRTLGGTFDLRRFRHIARYNEDEQRIEMHLQAQVPHAVLIRSAGLLTWFEPGETILTDSSYKFKVETTVEMIESAGFRLTEHWIDEEWPFCEALCRAV